MAMNVSAEDLRQIMNTRFGKDDDGSNPMTAAGIVLLAAGMHGITAPSELVQFTSYGRSFTSAIIFNLQNNGLWTSGHYDASSWLSPGGELNDREFWDHVSAACGELWLPEGDSNLSVDTCEIFWANQQRGLMKSGPNLEDWDGLYCDECQEPASHAKVDVEDCESHGDALIFVAYCHSHYMSNVLCSRWLHREDRNGQGDPNGTV
jgi:hypothetical protein